MSALRLCVPRAYSGSTEFDQCGVEFAHGGYGQRVESAAVFYALDLGGLGEADMGGVSFADRYEAVLEGRLKG